jgi:hypothetical protein
MPRRRAALLLIAIITLAVAVLLHQPGPTAAAQDVPTSTSLPVDQGNQGVIPLPNSGTRPQSPGDRGGWEQLLLAGIMTAGCALIFGRVLWAAHQRSQANARAGSDTTGGRVDGLGPRLD